MKTMVQRLKGDAAGGERMVVRAFPLRRLAESAAEVDVYSPVASWIAKFSLDRERRRKTRIEGLSLSFHSPPAAAVAAALSSLKKSKSTLELNLFLATRRGTIHPFRVST